MWEVEETVAGDQEDKEGRVDCYDAWSLIIVEELSDNVVKLLLDIGWGWFQRFQFHDIHVLQHK